MACERGHEKRCAEGWRGGSGGEPKGRRLATGNAAVHRCLAASASLLPALLALLGPAPFPRPSLSLSSPRPSNALLTTPLSLSLSSPRPSPLFLSLSLALLSTPLSLSLPRCPHHAPLSIALATPRPSPPSRSPHHAQLSELLPHLPLPQHQRPTMDPGVPLAGNMRSLYYIYILDSRLTNPR